MDQHEHTLKTLNWPTRARGGLRQGCHARTDGLHLGGAEISQGPIYAAAMTTPRKAQPAVDLQRCTGCGWCVAVCPPHVLSLEVLGPHTWGPKRSTLHDAPGCTGCALCALRCPFDAIAMVRVGP